MTALTAIRRSLLVTAVLMALAVASTQGQQPTFSSRADVVTVEVGMTQNQVFSILGQPQMREAYGPTEFLFYTSSYGASIPIAVVDGKVTSIGRAAYEIVVRSKMQTGSPSVR